MRRLRGGQGTESERASCPTQVEEVGDQARTAMADYRINRFPARLMQPLRTGLPVAPWTGCSQMTACLGGDYPEVVSNDTEMTARAHCKRPFPRTPRPSSWRHAMFPPADVQHTLTAVSTMLTPVERLRVDAAGEGLYHALHRDSVEDVIRD